MGPAGHSNSMYISMDRLSSEEPWRYPEALETLSTDQLHLICPENLSIYRETFKTLVTVESQSCNHPHSANRIFSHTLLIVKRNRPTGE